jgi:hypothetical protein
MATENNEVIKQHIRENEEKLFRLRLDMEQQSEDLILKMRQTDEKTEVMRREIQRIMNDLSSRLSTCRC